MMRGGGGGGGGGPKTKWKTPYPNFEELIESITNVIFQEEKSYGVSKLGGRGVLAASSDSLPLILFIGRSDDTEQVSYSCVSMHCTHMCSRLYIRINKHVHIYVQCDAIIIVHVAAGR